MIRHGFTLLELLTTLAIGAILLLIGVPGLQTLLADTAIQTEAFSIHTALHRARNLAIDNGEYVIACLADQQNKCVKKDFSHLLLFNDLNRDRQLTAGDGGDTILFQDSSFNQLTITTNQTQFIFQPDGTQAGTPGTITVCGENITHGFSIIVAMSGRVRKQDISCPSHSGS